LVAATVRAMSTDTASQPARPLRRDAERNRQRILAAATEVFAARGLEVTLDDIARHAGLGVGTVYRRFANKAALIEALFQEAIDQVVLDAEAAAAAPSPWDGFVDLLTALAERQVANKGLREVLRSTGYGQVNLARQRDRLRVLLEGLVARAQRTGELRPDVRASDVLLMLIMITETDEFGRSSDPDLWRRYLTLLLDGLRTSRAEPTVLPAPALDHDAVTAAMDRWPARRG
jgi:AcrR family transcriptional regulator